MKVSVICLILCFLFVSIGKEGLVYAQMVYPGVTLPSDRHDRDGTTAVKPERKGYHGLISGSSNFQRKETTAVPKTQRQIDKEVKNSLETLSGMSRAQFIKEQQAVRERAQRQRAKDSALEQEKRRLSEPSKMSKLRAQARRTRPETLEDIEMAALRRSSGSIPAGIDSMLEGISLPPYMIEVLSKPTVLSEDGLSLAERGTQLQILQLFSFLEDKMTRKDKKEAIRKIKNQLESMEFYTQQRLDLPERVFLKMGLPQVYIDQQEKEQKSAMKMIKSAQKQIKRYR